MKNKWVLYVLILTSTLFLEAEEKELIVSLPTRHALKSVSVQAPQKLDSFKEILINDINHNGSCFVEDECERSEYIITLEQIDNELLITTLSKRSGYHRSFPLVPLSTSTTSNRRAIHRISDQITEMISGTRGVASSRVFYAVQYPEKTGKGVVYKSEIWEADYDGKSPRQITYEKSYCISPVLFPTQGDYTKSRFLYVNYKQGQPKIYLGSFLDSKGEPFVKLRGNQLLPTISSKGDMIAFISDASGSADLFVQPFSPTHGLLGKPIQAYSYPRSVQASPTFRPDGKKIAFVSDKDGTPRIFLIDTPTPGKQIKPRPLCITKKYRHNTCPCWSPDGTKLAYSAMIDGSRQIMVYDFLTQEEIQLTSGKSHKENPSWAPNSLHIIYNTVDPSSSELFLINIKQKESIQITSGPGKKHYPAWEPRQL